MQRIRPVTMVNVGIAYPSDMAEACAAVVSEVIAWNAVQSDSRAVVFRPLDWSTSSTPLQGQGDGQEVINRQLIDKIAVLIVLLGGRLGTPTPRAVAGTIEELHRVTRAGGNTHVFLDTAPIDSSNKYHLESRLAVLEQIESLRREGLTGSFGNLSELRRSISNVLSRTADEMDTLMDRVGYARPVTAAEVDFDRTYEELSASAVYSVSDCGDKLDLDLLTRRTIRGNEPTGISSVMIDFSRTFDSSLSFTGRSMPQLDIVSVDRTAGTAILERPRKAAGSTFTQDVRFRPPIAAGEVVQLDVHVAIAEYSFRYREDLMAATATTPLGPRRYDFMSRIMSFPTNRLKLSIFLPEDSGLTPEGPKVGRSDSIDQIASGRLAVDGSYREFAGEDHGVPGTFMKLDVPHPQFRRHYRLCWNLPSRADKSSSR